MALTLMYHFRTACTTPLSVLCPYFRPQRPSVSFQSSLYNSCRDWSKTWCKFVDLFFLLFSTVNKCDERKKHVGHVREGLPVTLIPRRGQSSALVRRFKRRSDTFQAHLVFSSFKTLCAFIIKVQMKKCTSTISRYANAYYNSWLKSDKKFENKVLGVMPEFIPWIYRYFSVRRWIERHLPDVLLE